jgi:hypothetical protein
MRGVWPPGAWRRMPLGLLGMVVIVALVERQIDRHPLEMNELQATSWRFAKNQARRQAPGAQILLFGSSVIKFGLHPAILEEKTGRPTFNLAVYGGQLTSSYYMFKHALEAGAKPAAVVIDCHEGPIPKADADKPNEIVALNMRNWPEILTGWEAAELAWHGKFPSVLAATTVARLVPSVKSRHEIRGQVMAALDGKEEPTRQKNLSLLRNWNMNKGAQVMTPNQSTVDDGAPLDSAAAELPEGQFVGNKFMEIYVRKFLDLARDHKIPVFWVMAPLSPAVLTMQHNGGFERFATDCANAVQKRYANVIVVDGRRSGYTSGAFSDKTHLNMTGNATLSEDLGEVIAARLSGAARGSRWVFLPKYRPPAANRPSEDFQRSWAAVESATRKR